MEIPKKKKKNTVSSKEAGVEGGTILFCIFFNIVIRGSPEQRCEGNPMNIWGRESRQILKPETGAHLAGSSSKEASAGEGQLEKQ